MMCDLTQERDFYKAKCEGKTYLSTPSNSPDKQNDLIELAECKSQIRKLKQELYVYISYIISLPEYRLLNVSQMFMLSLIVFNDNSINNPHDLWIFL
jgi:hypothetical protein